MSERIQLEEAVERLLAATQAPSLKEAIPLMEAAGRVSAVDAIAVGDLPPFDRSPLDGYAVHHADVAGASLETPVRLPVTQRVYAGEAARLLARGEAACVMTGAPIPNGATCMVWLEETREERGVVEILAEFAEHENYCFRGEDVKAGKVLLRRGDVLTGGRVALLAGQGAEDTEVIPLPRIGVLSTGGELMPQGQPLHEGKIYDSNRFLLAALAQEMGASISMTRVEPDDPDRLAAAIAELAEQSDLVLTSGGVSAGERDCLPDAAEILGARKLFRGIDVRPGGPAMALHRDGKVILCLSGNPFAAFVTALVLAGPVIRKLAGRTGAPLEKVKGILREPFAKASSMRRLVPAWMTGNEISFPSGRPTQRSLLSLVKCNCLLDIARGSPELNAGQPVEVIAT